MTLIVITSSLFISLLAAITYKFLKESSKPEKYERWDRGE